MNRVSQSGNVFFIIFLGIALFAALGYAVSGSMRNRGDFGDKEKVDVQVTDILSYANAISTAVKVLNVNGCSDTQISFESPVISGYANSNSPSSGDKSCWVFDPAGGGLTYKTPDINLLDPAQSAQTRYGEWYFTGRYCVNYIGTGDSYSSSCTTNSSDLLLALPYVKKSVCENIKNLSGQTVYSGLNNVLNAPFSGIYSSTVWSDGNADRKMRFCTYYNTGGVNRYVAYFVILAR